MKRRIEAQTSNRCSARRSARVAPLDRLLAFAVRHGVKVVKVDEIPFRFVSPFSTSVGLAWGPKKLYVKRGVADQPLTVGQLIHELGHLLGTREPPSTVDELSFLGWEWRVALQLGLRRQWTLAMEHYGTDMNEEYGYLTSSERRAVLRRAMADGKKNGSVSPSGRPVAMR